MTTKIDDARLAGALEHWRGVNLTGLLSELDAAGIEIVENQKTSLQQRRQLAEKTKEFRQVSDDQKAIEFKPLLRAYQNEIDALTKRMKYAENSFLRVFQALSTAPDPEPFISGLVDERKNALLVNDLTAENERLQEKVQGLMEDNNRMGDQEKENERLRAQVEGLQKTMTEKVAELVGQREREVREQSEDLIRHLKEREGDLQRQLSAANRTLIQQQSNFDSSETQLAKNSDNERELVGKIAELDIVQSDLDHANARLADMQMQNAKLRNELMSLTGDTSVDGVVETLAEYKRRVVDLDEETKRLFGNLEKAEAQIALQEARAEAAMNVAEQEALAKEDELKRLRMEVKRRSDYDELKRDLEIMKSVEFSVSDWGLDDDDAKENVVDETLEKLLVRRNKTLENKLTDARNQLEVCVKGVKEQTEKCETLEVKLEEKSKLAERLEADLLSVKMDTGENPGSSDNNASAMQKGDHSGLLDIVTGQRDRFRQRTLELEDTLREHTSLTTELKHQVDQVKQDNLRLYEEIKYLRSSYSSNNNQLPPVTSKFSSSAGNSRVQIDMDTGVAAKYKGLYEESLNPFNVFHRRETSRRVRSMGILDRLIYMFSNFVMGNRKARVAMLGYLALLHLLVFVTLYRSVLLSDQDTHEPVAAPLIN
ncbi:hypothetical protein H4R99_001422 [Coemansia sp. RSA 1722]|nr:hypothetical protein LPJ57_000880 [Coemansia sp. RSA 486]KAJ2601653.1 hypothetical protein GGF39_001133 [Coemansia sp. RSA 1721]KAJ2605019.1 hypothetical protein H4R99_001422 [Coemansia sp. RSA 1722]KAJ2638939.1 hypothetical protein GGF40_001270 [Coemansia sp. RSA 1286]